MRKALRVVLLIVACALIGTALDIGNDLTLVARVIASAIGLGVFIFALPVRIKSWT